MAKQKAPQVDPSIAPDSAVAWKEWARQHNPNAKPLPANSHTTDGGPPIDGLSDGVRDINNGQNEAARIGYESGFGPDSTEPMAPVPYKQSKQSARPKEKVKK